MEKRILIREYYDQIRETSVSLRKLDQRVRDVLTVKAPEPAKEGKVPAGAWKPPFLEVEPKKKKEDILTIKVAKPGKRKPAVKKPELSITKPKVSGLHHITKKKLPDKRKPETLGKKEQIDYGEKPPMVFKTLLAELRKIRKQRHKEDANSSG